jgi:hypothetical protein
MRFKQQNLWFHASLSQNILTHFVHTQILYQSNFLGLELVVRNMVLDRDHVPLPSLEVKSLSAAHA